MAGSLKAGCSAPHTRTPSSFLTWSCLTFCGSQCDSFNPWSQLPPRADAPHLLPEIQIHPRGQLHLLSLKLRSTWSASLFLQPHCDRPASHFLPLGERTPLYSQSEAWEGDGQGGPWAEHPLLRGRHLACSKSSPTCKLRRECTAFLRGFLRIKYCLRNSSQMLLYNIHVP